MGSAPALALGLFGGVLSVLLIAVGSVVVLVPGATASLNRALLPAEYAQLIADGGRRCPQISAPLLAAQLEAESNFDPRAVSSVGAMGLAQFMPGTWSTWGRDVDGNGTASAFDAADAIDAQARFMCDLYRTAASSGIRGDPVVLALAGYNAGWGAVAKHRGVPPYAETRSYVQRIIGAEPRFRASTVVALGRGFTFAGAIAPIADRPNPRAAAEAVAWAAREAQIGSAGWFNRCLNFMARSYGWNNSGT
ncbi:MAG: lytic transglycosylase domain-containing protein, partial [Sporichthyaceae bacterium]